MRNQEPFLKGYKNLSIPIMDEGGASAWPELFPAEHIGEIRIRTGARHFAAQMMLDPAPIARARLDPRDIRFYFEEPDMRAARLGDIPLTGWALYWDPSGARKDGDASVCVFLLRDDKGRRAFIHDCIYISVGEDEPERFLKQCVAVLDFMKSRGLKNIAVEINGIGGAMPEIIRCEAALREQAAHVAEITNHENKTGRILDAIEPLLGTGRLYAHERIRDSELIGDMEDWTPDGSTRDDALDALAGAIRMNSIPLHPRGIVRTLSAKTDFAV